MPISDLIVLGIFCAFFVILAWVVPDSNDEDVFVDTPEFHPDPVERWHGYMGFDITSD